jgi:hypothetical protein
MTMMKNWSQHLLLIGCSILLFGLSCSQPPSEQELLREFPMNSLEGLITRSDVHVDTAITSDGGGSLRVSAPTPRTIRLYETGDLDLENARLIYQAQLRTEDLEGQVYLEMWCRFPGKGEFFSRAVNTSLSGTVEWTRQETPFFLKKKENPDNVRLNLVVDGKGTVWIDEVRLFAAPH